MSQHEWWAPGRRVRLGVWAGVVSASALFAGCTPVHPVGSPEFSVPPKPAGDASALDESVGAGEAVDGREGSRAEEAAGQAVPPASPLEVRPGPTGDAEVWRRALASDEERIVVSREARFLWLMRGDSVAFAAPVAVGRDTIFEYRGKSYDFSTPTGQRTVLGKEENPEWVPPDWHYFEKASEDGLEPVQLGPSDRIELSDGTVIEVRGSDVGRVNQFGYWRAFDPGQEIIFDDQIFIPPFGSPQRRIPDELGTHRLLLGDGYLIHGTPKTDSIGQYASHGCVRMFNRDIAWLYAEVANGAPVYIY